MLPVDSVVFEDRIVETSVVVLVFASLVVLVVASFSLRAVDAFEVVADLIVAFDIAVVAWIAAVQTALAVV